MRSISDLLPGYSYPPRFRPSREQKLVLASLRTQAGRRGYLPLEDALSVTIDILSRERGAGVERAEAERFVLELTKTDDEVISRKPLEILPLRREQGIIKLVVFRIVTAAGTLDETAIQDLEWILASISTELRNLPPPHRLFILGSIDDMYQRLLGECQRTLGRNVGY